MYWVDIVINKTYEIIDKIDASHLKKRLDEIKIIINNDNEIKNIIKKFEESKELFEKYNIKDDYLKAKEELFQNDIIKEYNNQKKALENTYSNKQKLQKEKIKFIIGASLACIICIILCASFSYKYKVSADKQVALAQKELNDFAQKFECVEAFNEGDLSFSDNLVTVSDVLIEPSKDIDNTMLVQFALKHTGNDYGIRLNSESSIILILNDGSVMECKIYNEKYPYSHDVYIGNGSTCTILPHEFYDISINDINYVKLSKLWPIY